MKITVDDVIHIHGIGFFQRDGKPWNNLQRWCQIGHESTNYFVSHDAGYGTLVLNALFATVPGQHEMQIILCSNSLAKDFEKIKSEKGTE